MSRLALVAVALFFSLPARAVGVAGMFGQGQTQFHIEAGNGYAFNHSYQILGAGASYYLFDGLAVGLAFENWSGSGPGIRKVTPSMQYVFYQASRIKPYLGAFYRHATVAGLPAINSAGARAGIYLASGTRSAVGIGYVYESYRNCNAAVYAACSEGYPEFSAVFAF